MRNTSYSDNNVDNYALYLLNNGLKVGDVIYKNHNGRIGNSYKVIDITDTEIRAELESVKTPNKKVTPASSIIININSCGSFPAYIK